MKVRIRKTEQNAVIPAYSNPGDAGLDLTVTSVTRVDDEHVKYGFGLAVEIPAGFVGLMFPRSSCYKQRQLMSNAVGVVDAGYRGEISAVMIGTSLHSYKIGDRAAQLIIMPYPEVEFEEVDELSTTDRGVHGFGSTGK